MEIDDYNSEFFFEQEDNWEQYQDFLYEDELTPQEQDSSYTIFILEQAISDIKEIGKLSSTLGLVCDNAVKSIEKVLQVFTEHMNGE